MLTKRIIPCLDVKGGRVVKGVSFVNLIDAGDPVEIAKVYDEQGADELTFLDITASHEERGIILDVVRRTAEQVFMPLTVGGGIKNLDDIRNLLLAGADKVSINTTAVHDPEFIKAASMRFGSQCIVVAIDAKRVVAHDKDFKPPLTWADDPKYRALFLSNSTLHTRTPHSNGKSTRTAAGSPWASMLLPGRARWRSTAPGRSCSRA